MIWYSSSIVLWLAACIGSGRGSLLRHLILNFLLHLSHHKLVVLIIIKIMFLEVSGNVTLFDTLSKCQFIKGLSLLNNHDLTEHLWWDLPLLDKSLVFNHCFQFDFFETFEQVDSLLTVHLLARCRLLVVLLGNLLNFLSLIWLLHVALS